MFLDGRVFDADYSPAASGGVIIIGYLLVMVVCMKVARWTGWASEQRVQETGLAGGVHALGFGLCVSLGCYIVVYQLELLPDAVWRAVEPAALVGWGWGAGREWGV